MERGLSGHDVVVLFLDGKSLSEDEMIIALGVTLAGEKVVLGFLQAGSEDERVVRDFLNGPIERGLNIEQGLLCVIDRSKGLPSAIGKILRDKAVVQRCQWHKPENNGVGRWLCEQSGLLEELFTEAQMASDCST